MGQLLLSSLLIVCEWCTDDTWFFAKLIIKFINLLCIYKAVCKEQLI
jgi:hypothetical protein